MGAFTCNPRIKTIVDIDGQYVKGIAIADDGSVREFAMNDKCAAGTVPFFEAMSRVFRMDIESFCELSLKAHRTVLVTSQCSVFAETEVISLLAKRPPDEVAAGIQAAVAKPCFALLKRVEVRSILAVTGGCAKKGARKNARGSHRHGGGVSLCGPPAYRSARRHGFRAETMRVD